MPLTKKGAKVMAAMKKQYGAKKAKQVFYASANKGTITGVHRSPAQFVQHFDEREVTQEAPPRAPLVTGNPGTDILPRQVGGPTKAGPEMSGRENYRSDNRVLVGDTPDSSKAKKNVWPNKLRIYRDTET